MLQPFNVNEQKLNSNNNPQFGYIIDGFRGQSSALLAGANTVPRDYYTFSSGEVHTPGGGAVETVVIGGVEDGKPYTAGIVAGGKDFTLPLGGAGKIGVGFFGGGELTQGGHTAPIGLLNIDLGPIGFGGFKTTGEAGLFVYRNVNKNVSIGGGAGWKKGP